MTRILLLGGTTEASRMARALAEAGLPAVFSYAGRTEAPVAQPIPTRVGGFGGPEGLADYIRAEAITHVIDATHPFAAQMSRNAITACAASDTPLLALERPAWAAQPGDSWTHAPDIAGAVAALPDAPAPYNLLVTSRWLMAVPRRAERWEGVSVNALGFAGALLARDAAEADRIAAAPPSRVLAAVAG